MTKRSRQNGKSHRVRALLYARTFSVQSVREGAFRYYFRNGSTMVLIAVTKKYIREIIRRIASLCVMFLMSSAEQYTTCAPCLNYILF